MLIMIITTPINFRVAHITWTNTSAKCITTMTRLTIYLAKLECLRAQNQKLRILRTPTTLDSSNSNCDSSFYSEWLSQTDRIIQVTISNMKYATNFPVTIHRNRTISLFDTGTIISCMSKSCFNKLQLQPKLVRTNTCKVNIANWNSLGPIGMTTCTLKVPKKFYQ